jgi:4a-hydroxytetrahydrobiopterin dehydratase
MAETETKLSETEAQARLAQVSGWTIHNGELQRTFTTPTFPTSIFFVGAVAQVAEAAQHHPDITISYTTVTLTVSTHSAGGLTEKDFSLASKVNSLWDTLSA